MSMSSSAREQSLNWKHFYHEVLVEVLIEEHQHSIEVKLFSLLYLTVHPKSESPGSPDSANDLKRLAENVKTIKFALFAGLIE